MNLALDTNAYTDLCRGVGRVRHTVEFAESVAIPFVVLAELKAGFGAGKRSGQNEATLSRFLEKPRVS